MFRVHEMKQRMVWLEERMGEEGRHRKDLFASTIIISAVSSMISVNVYRLEERRTACDLILTTASLILIWLIKLGQGPRSGLITIFDH